VRARAGGKNAENLRKGESVNMGSDLPIHGREKKEDHLGSKKKMTLSLGKKRLLLCERRKSTFHGRSCHLAGKETAPLGGSAANSKAKDPENWHK